MADLISEAIFERVQTIQMETECVTVWQKRYPPIVRQEEDQKLAQTVRVLLESQPLEENSHGLLSPKKCDIIRQGKNETL